MSFPNPDVRLYGYAPAACPNCDRLRLEIYVDGDEGDIKRFVGLQCEKCHAQWLLDPEKLDYYHESDHRNPLKPIKENNPFTTP